MRPLGAARRLAGEKRLGKSAGRAPRELVARILARARGGAFRRAGRPIAAGLALLGLSFASNALPVAAPRTLLHYAPNQNFTSSGDYLPGRVGFNVADVGKPRELAFLPAHVKALVWVGQCNGVTTKFLKTVQPYIGSPKVFGFYLMDNPDPRTSLLTPRFSPSCTAEHLRAESDWIHAHAPGAKTFMVLMNLGSSQHPAFDAVYRPTNLHVDLFGLDPYPCRSELGGCDYDMIDRYVAAAESVGIPLSRIVPIYQAFGGGAWADDGGGHYNLPTGRQERRILSRWGMLVGTTVFDYAYSWGSQKQDDSLEGASHLRTVFALHNDTTKAPRPGWKP